MWPTYRTENLLDHAVLSVRNLQHDSGALLLQSDEHVRRQRTPAAPQRLLLVALDDLADLHRHAELVGELDGQVRVFGGQELREARVFEVAHEQLLGERVDNRAAGAGAHADDAGQDLQVDARFDAERQDLAGRGDLRLRGQVVAQLDDRAVAARPQ